LKEHFHHPKAFHEAFHLRQAMTAFSDCQALSPLIYKAAPGAALLHTNSPLIAETNDASGSSSCIGFIGENHVGGQGIGTGLERYPGYSPEFSGEWRYGSVTTPVEYD
jgi:hypothetical protein